VLVAEEDAGQRLYLDLPHRGELRLREPAHLSLDERDVLDHLGGQPGDDVLYLRRSQPERLG